MKSEEILSAIEQKRKQMIDAVLQHGIAHNITIKYSKELDTLLNQYQKKSSL